MNRYFTTCYLNRIGMLLLLFLLSIDKEVAQEYHGITGLLHIPSAETDSSGTFRGGVSYFYKEFIPAQFGQKFNTFGYTIGITTWKWMEISYSATLLKYIIPDKSPHPRFYNEDRHVNVKVVPLYERHWWPGLAVGMDDVGRFNRIKDGDNNNNYYQNIYIVGSKHFDIQENELGVHILYRYYSQEKNASRRGIAGGVTFRPSFYRPLRIIAEWDGVGVNAGADVLLWRHLFLQACLVHGRGFTGGISYHYTIHF